MSNEIKDAIMPVMDARSNIIGYGPGGAPIYAEVPDECVLDQEKTPDCAACRDAGIGCARGAGILRQRKEQE